MDSGADDSMASDYDDVSPLSADDRQDHGKPREATGSIGSNGDNIWRGRTNYEYMMTEPPEIPPSDWQNTWTNTLASELY